MGEIKSKKKQPQISLELQTHFILSILLSDVNFFLCNLSFLTSNLAQKTHLRRYLGPDLILSNKISFEFNLV